MARRWILLLLWTTTALATEAPDEMRFVDLFTPLRTEIAALSPDGRRLAFSVRESSTLSVMAMDVDESPHATMKMGLMLDEHAKRHMKAESENELARIRWMRWVSPTRLVLETNLKSVVARFPRALAGTGMVQPVRRIESGAVYGLDYDGSHAAIMVTPRESDGPVRICEQMVGDDGEVIIQSGRDMERLNGVTGARHSLTEKQSAAALEHWRTEVDSLRPLWRVAYGEMKTTFPGYEVDLAEQLKPTQRVLAQVQHIADPGAYVVYDRELHKAWNLVRRAGDTTSASRQLKATEFDITGSSGEHFTGVLVRPINPRIMRAPVIYWIPEKLGRHNRRDYSPQIHALAQMGFAVALIDGVAHTRSGLAARVNEEEEIAHLSAAVDVLAERYGLSRRAVGIVGTEQVAKYGLEVVTRDPEKFRVAILLDVIGKDDGLTKSLVSRQGENATRIMFWSYAGRNGRQGTDRQYLEWHVVARELERGGFIVSWNKLGLGYRNLQPKERAAVFRGIEKFLIEHLYRYAVELGELREVSVEGDHSTAEP